MSMSVATEPAAIAPEDLAPIRALYEEGRCLEAYERSRPFGPLPQWRGTPARILAGSLAAQLGSPRLGSAIHVRAWREAPNDPEACLYYSYEVLSHRGPLATWEFLRQVGTLPEAEDRIRGYWLSMHSVVLGQFRDFDAAESWLARAEEAAPGLPWLLVQRAHLYEMEDRYDDALAASREALERRPSYRVAVQQNAQLLQLLDRDEEAEALLSRAIERIESSGLMAQLGVLRDEMGRHAEARRTWDRLAETFPLLEARFLKWLAGRRSDAAYECGDVVAAAAWARECGEPFFMTLAPRLEDPDADVRRVRLDVGFVRQHHQTCAPATLAALARFWNRPADHLEVAEEICYDGTPDHRQRTWAERNGYLAREFTVTWESARALLDRGVPFTLATVETQSAHLQAVIGYDARRGTLLIRDPTMPYSGEAMGKELLERYRSTGPRGMAMVPDEQAALLDGLDLPESSLYDHLHRMQVALHEHDRERAAAAFEALGAEAPGHRLALHARCILAQYDADPAELLAGIEAQLALFPDDVNLRLSQLSCLRNLGRRDDRLALYEGLCARKDADPLLRRQYARELLPDAREHPRVVELVRRALRYRPLDAPGLTTLADVERDAGRMPAALDLYRLAACLDDKDEGLARNYFYAARHLHREDDALEFLRGRFRRLGKLSGWPARTLYFALCQLERGPEAFAILDEAQQIRPDDGELRMFAAESHAAHGEFDRAAERLEAARGLCRRGDWLRAAAYLASVRGDLAASLDLWRQVLQAEPAAIDANRAIATRLAETEGRAAALEHLAAACDRFPHNFALIQAWIDWLRDDGPAALEPAVRRLLAIHPADAWARRELALILARQGRHEEAAEEMRLATQLEPSSPSEAAVRAQLLEMANERVEARAAYREAIRRSVDMEFAIDRLIETADTKAERSDDLAFVEAELRRQVIFGDGLLAFARLARRTMEPDPLLAALRAAKEARPDLWHAWSALVQELAGRGQSAEALELAREAAERFPLLPRIWLDLAAACRASEDREGETRALDRALELAPGWGVAARQRAMALEKQGDYAGSRAVLERAVAHAPLDAFNHGCLADAMWHLDDREPALERLLHALRLEPDYDWGWDTLARWARELKRPGLPVELARELTEKRGGEARNWLRLARSLDGPEHLEERLAAFDRAIALDPRDFTAYDLKAELLAQAGRWDEAEALCGPGPWGERPPIWLRGRAAWLIARRGDLPGAMERMRSVLAEDPDYYWGWLNFTEWASEAGEPVHYLWAAEALARLTPNDPVAAGYLGDARLCNSMRTGAREAFEHGFRSDPDHAYTAMRLFDMRLEDGQLDEAARVLESLKERQPGPFTLAREVQLAQARGDRNTASTALERLCVTPGTESEWPLSAADQAFTETGWGRQAEAIYARALDHPDVRPQVGKLWVERCIARRHWRCEKRIRTLLGRGEVGLHAMEAYLAGIGRARKEGRLNACLRRHGELLRAHTRCWGAAGYALTAVARHRAAIRWMSDWQTRDDARPWMLINLAIALRAHRRVDEANRVSRRALELGSDYTTPYHRIWLALDDLIDGDGHEAAARLDGIDPQHFDMTNRYLFRLARFLIERREATPADRPAVLKSTTREFSRITAQATIPPDDYMAVVRTYQRVVRRMAADRGRFSGLLWRFVRELQAPRVGR